MNEMVDFGTVIHLMKSGKKMKRKSWNIKDRYIGYQKSKCEGFNIVYMGFMNFATGNLVKEAWFPTQEDMLAEDWIIYENKTDEIIIPAQEDTV